MRSLSATSKETLAKPLGEVSNLNKILIAVLVISVISGILTGYTLADKKSSNNLVSGNTTAEVKNPEQDTRTFRDFAEGTIKARPKSKDAYEYIEGSYILHRDNNQYPVALTSSVVDLSEYEGKKVKVHGETQKALKEGWLMDVGRVEEIK